MSASEDHGTAVNTALGEAQTLAAEAERNLQEAIENAAGHVGAAIDALKATVTALAAQSENSHTAANATLGPAEVHVNATQIAGQGTLGHVEAAQEACQYAANNALGVTEFLGTLQGAVTEMRDSAITSLMSVVPQLEDGVNGAKAVVDHLTEAQAQIAAAQNPQ